MQGRELGLQGLRIARRLRRFPRRQLLRQQRFGVGLVLGRAVQVLRVGVELGIQSHQYLQIVILVAGQLAHVLILEGRQLLIQIVEILLGIFHLLGEKKRGALRRVLP